MEDKRFVHVATDPKFRHIPKGERKVKIDKRFQSMFKDEKFKVKYTIDSRGRPLNRTSTEDLKRYYDLSSENSSSEDENAETEPGKYVKALKDSEEEPAVDTNHLEINESDTKISNDIKSKLRNLEVDYARGKSKLFSESSSDDESEPEELSFDEIEHNWGELDADAERKDEITCRLAACNMDWDRIKAVDLMILFNSFVPPGGIIKSVTIYPSEFGKERMKEEEIKGPIELVERKTEDENDNEEHEEGSKYHMEKLRQYQLNRLKYYYAVIICDSANTANKIYIECDGMEYESSATKIDLRFIPDDMSFDEEPKEICDKVPDITKYQPRFFTTTALQQAKVNLTWDETKPERIEITQKIASGKIDDIDENDLQEYLASSSGDENDETEQSESESVNENANPIDKYRALLSEIETKEKEKDNKDVEMEISWGIDIKEKADKLIKKRQTENENKTPFQQYLEKRKEKQKEKREERRKMKNCNKDSEDSDVPSDIDMNDPYFAEEFDNQQFKGKKKSKSIKQDETIDTQKEYGLELLLMNDDDKKHFNFKKIQEQENESKSKKKRKKKQVEEKVDDFEINVNDERFSALYTSHHFNIDPTDSHYKKTRGIVKLINEKVKRRNEDMEEEVSKKTKTDGKKKDAELNVLIKSIKRKAQAFVNKNLN